MKQEPKNICVFAASSNSVSDTFADAARVLGALIARRGWTVVNGAGAQGLMRAVSDGALDAGGHVRGVIPKFMVDNRWDYDRLPELIITADMHERKQRMVLDSDAIIALPGGIGTLEELLEALTWRQLGIISQPIVILNTDGFFNPLFAVFDQCVKAGCLKQAHTALHATATTPEQAVETIERLLRQPPQPHTSKYD